MVGWLVGVCSDIKFHNINNITLNCSDCLWTRTTERALLSSSSYQFIQLFKLLRASGTNLMLIVTSANPGTYTSCMQLERDRDRQQRALLFVPLFGYLDTPSITAGIGWMMVRILCGGDICCSESRFFFFFYNAQIRIGGERETQGMCENESNSGPSPIDSLFVCFANSKKYLCYYICGMVLMISWE